MQYDSIVYVDSVPVYLRRLPSGDMSVWHPFNEHIRRIVEPICRQRGYWEPTYNNWIVFKCFAGDVCNALQKAGRSLVPSDGNGAHFS